jgi:SAM-dependent methyltransferase
MGESTSSRSEDLPISIEMPTSTAGRSTGPAARSGESVTIMPRSLRQEKRVPEPDQAPRLAEIAVCLDCRSGLAGREICPGCGKRYPESNGIVAMLDELRGRNRIAGAFYDGPGWVRFRPWERLFLKLQGGESRARRQILRHLTAPPFARVLEVGIGDGANLALLPKDWAAFGVDIALTPLEDCLELDPRMVGRLARAEAEALPFADDTFDACWTLGGFNYFADHDAALREMKRVTRPGGALVVADELPNLHRLGIGHLIGVKAIDAFWLRALGLDREFVEMVLNHDFDPDLLVRDAWPNAVRHSIWGGLGYCYVEFDSRCDTPSDSRLAPNPWSNPS